MTTHWDGCGVIRLWMLFVILVSAGGGPGSTGAAQKIRSLDTVILPPGSLAMAAPGHHPKLDSDLAAVAEAAKRSRGEGVARAQALSLPFSQNRVLVQVALDSKGLKRVVDAIREAGGEIASVGFRNSMVQCWLPVTVLERIAALPEVGFMHRPFTAMPDDDSSTSESLDAAGATAWHAAGYRGKGVKIGIIDVGFAGYDALLGTELPASVTVKNFVPGETDAQVDGTETHGTACAELIHDMAPDAELFFAKIRFPGDLAGAVAWLKDTCQVAIISMSVSFFLLDRSPGDGTGPVADLVKEARSAGILWVKSAGNSALTHWGGGFYDPDGNGIHNYTDTREMNYFVDGYGYPSEIPPNTHLCVYARWDDWTDIDQDYDLYLYRWDGTLSRWQTDQPVAQSEWPQNGLFGQQPMELACGDTSGGATLYGFIVLRKSGTRNVDLEIFTNTLYPLQLNDLLRARSLTLPADSPDLMTVGAVDASSRQQEIYSSEGPTSGPGGTAEGGFIKPDICGYDRVSTETYGTRGFVGTSATAPEVAGAAALVLEAYPSYGPDELEAYLANNAVDIGDAGVDTRSGYGLLTLGEPPPPHPPGVPETIDYPASDGDGSFIISWASVPGAESYSLERMAGAETAQGTAVYSGDAARYDEAGLTPGTYFYRVRANNGIGSSDWKTGGPIVVGISGAAPEISVTDSVPPVDDLSVPFGGIAAGSSSQQVVTVTNIGDASLELGPVAEENPLAAPFQITEDTCSGGALPPAATCTIRLKFSPSTLGTWDDDFDIPSNDSDESAVIVAVRGMGVTAVANHPPSVPQLVYPADGQKGLATRVTFRWGRCSDPDQDAVSYGLFCCQNRDFSGCGPFPAAVSARGITGYGVLALLGTLPLVLFLFTAGRRGPFLLVALTVAAAVVWVSCGGSGSGDGREASEEIARTVTGLEAGATYYWKVLARDDGGEESTSAVRSFTTAP